MVRRLTPDEKLKLADEIKRFTRFPIVKKISDKDLKVLDSKMVIDLLQSKTNSYAFAGEAVYGAPKEMQVVLDFTCLRGGASNIYHSFIYRAPKWRFTVKKVDDTMLISPIYAEFYNITIAQKQKIEQTIKTGLTSAAQAVADYELLAHDTRRYKEIIDYFVDAKKTGDEHVLRSLFVDRVDAYTGEGYSMVTMARRWPTIITDFIRLDEKLDDVDKIRKAMDVSAAEATVLKTKNRLYREWKEMFLPVVKERYARIENLAKARKKSIEEYRKWLKPYIAKFKAMKEQDETSPSSWVTDAYYTPGFGQSEAMLGTRIWIWKSFNIVEGGKPPAVHDKRGGAWRIDPYDDWVKAWQKLIEYKYSLKFEDGDVDAILKQATSKEGMGFENQQMYPEEIYYILFDIQFILGLLRTPPPEGVETDNLMLFPLTTWIMSQNVMLLYIMELNAKEHAMEHYINEIIGAKSIEEEVLREVEERFKEEKEPGRMMRFKKRTERFRFMVGNFFNDFFHLFVRRGPYEAIFYERVSKMYFRVSGRDFKTVTQFFKDAMSIGK